jgi:N-acetylglucosaminyl-diphospho-decaprenol L-rhamnosyltransferase
MARPNGNGKSDAPLVSVIIISYESGPTLARCLEALRAQTFTDFEILLVDNASTDGAPQIAAAADPAIRFLQPGDQSRLRGRQQPGGARSSRALAGPD